MYTATGRWQLGFIMSLTTAVLWGLLPIALKVVLTGLDAYTITWCRFAVSMLVRSARFFHGAASCRVCAAFDPEHA